MMPYDFSETSDEMLDNALANGWALSQEARIEAAKERARRDAARREAAVTPDVENNLEASATPIAPDPSLKPKAESPQDVMRRRMRAAGYPEPMIEAAVRQEAGMDYPFAIPDSDEGLRRGVEGLRASEAMDARLGEAYEQPSVSLPPRDPAAGQWTNPADGGPSRLYGGNVPNWAQGSFGAGPVTVDGVTVTGYDRGDGKLRYSLGQIREAQEQQDADFRRAGGRHGVPGPRTDDGRPAAPPPEFSSPEEAEAYYARPTDPRTGQLMPSQADRAMMARGFVPVYTPTGEISYRLAANYDMEEADRGDAPSPAAARYASYLEGRPADGRAVPERAGDAPSGALYERREIAGPFGMQSVLVPTVNTQKYNADRRESASIARIAARTGLTPDKLREMTAQQRAEAMLTASEARTQQARDFLRNRNQLAGGASRVGGNNVAMWNNLALMPEADRQTQMKYALPGGALRADVDRAHNEQLTALGLRVAQGQGFQQMTPEQQKLLELKSNEAERGLPPEERARQYRDQPDIHQSELDMVDNYVNSNFSSPGSVWGLYGLSSSFTIAEQQQTVDHLVNNLGYEPGKAQRLVDAIATRRGGQSWWGNWSGE